MQKRLIARKARQIITVILIKPTDASKTSGTESTGSNQCMLKVIILNSEKGYVVNVTIEQSFNRKRGFLFKKKIITIK